MAGQDTTETLISKLTYPKFLQEKYCKLFGMVLQFSSEDSHLKKFIRKQINIHRLHFWTKSVKFVSTLLVIPRCWCVLLCALTWVAYQFLISDPIMVGCAFAMDQSMISSEELDRVLPCKTCLILTTPFMKMELCCASKK